MTKKNLREERLHKDSKPTGNDAELVKHRCDTVDKFILTGGFYLGFTGSANSRLFGLRACCSASPS